MARYVVEEETTRGRSGAAPVGVEGLTVAKELARKRARQASCSVVVRDVESGRVLARFEPDRPEGEAPSLANSVRRMRAANDRLKDALVPPKSKRG
jgi:hypothetical protein